MAKQRPSKKSTRTPPRQRTSRSSPKSGRTVAKPQSAAERTPNARVLGNQSLATIPTTGPMIGRDKPAQVGTAILGAGIAGMSAALHLKKDYAIFEQAERIGGLCCTENFGGFLFDRSIHILYTRQPYAKKFITGLLGSNFSLRPKYSYIYSHGVYTAYPYQSNTFGLPHDVVVRNLMGLIEATYTKPQREPRNFKEWAYATFGAGITEEFFLPFNYKVWAIDQEEMSYDWIADRVLTPPIKTAIEGAIAPSKGEYGPNAKFWYPKKGGMESLPRAMGAHLNDESVHTFARVKTIHVAKHMLEFEDGSTCRSTCCRAAGGRSPPEPPMSWGGCDGTSPRTRSAPSSTSRRRAPTYIRNGTLAAATASTGPSPTSKRHASRASPRTSCGAEPRSRSPARSATRYRSGWPKPSPST